MEIYLIQNTLFAWNTMKYQQNIVVPIEHILRNAALRNSAAKKMLYSLEVSMLVGIGEGGCGEEVKGVRLKENSLLTTDPYIMLPPYVSHF